jgi:hypothetical protein
MRRRIICISVFLLCSAIASRAGGPAFIAGSGYLAGVEGKAMTWANGSVQYFTDQGNLSPILTGAQADALVANAFSAWTSIPGVALTSAQAGNLAEDVNGANIAATLGGVVTAPTDITASATSTPLGIVYDFDGTVTNALLGEGAGGLARWRGSIPQMLIPNPRAEFTAAFISLVHLAMRCSRCRESTL